MAWFLFLGIGFTIFSDDLFAQRRRRRRTNRQVAQRKPRRIRKKQPQRKRPIRRKRVGRTGKKRRNNNNVMRPRPYRSFSTTVSKFLDNDLQFRSAQSEYVWEEASSDPFNELIFSWNAWRPENGKLTFAVSVKHGKQWSNWHRIAEWGPDYQRTFINKRHPYVHTKHVRAEMQKGCLGRGFRVRVVSSGGADLTNLKALFACLSNTRHFQINTPKTDMRTVVINGVPRQSQMVIDHPRRKDLCSPTSTSVVVNYFMKQLYGELPNMHDYIVDFADKVHDAGPNIYGNWLFNVAQAYDSSNGDVFYRVERLNGFNDLYNYLSREIPIVVSVRQLRGGATPYRNGHILVVAGYDAVKKTVMCIDPAFRDIKYKLKSYALWDFLRAWGRSQNLSYIPLPIKGKWAKNEVF